MRIILLLCIATLTIIGCDKSPDPVQPTPTRAPAARTPLPRVVVPPVQPGNNALPQQHVDPVLPTPLPSVTPAPTVADIDQKFDVARKNVEADKNALLKAQKSIFDRLATNPKYVQAIKAHDDASQQVKDAVKHGENVGNDFEKLTNQLAKTMQALADTRREILDSDQVIVAARKKVTADEVELEAILKEKGVRIAATPAPTAPTTPVPGSPNIPVTDSGDSVLFPVDVRSGGVYVPGYYQKDGTYVPPHYQQ